MSLVYAKKIGAAQSQRLPATLVQGLREIGVRPADIQGKKVLIKPNLAGPSSAPHPFSITSRDMILGLVQVVKDFGAEEVTVADYAAGYVPDRTAFFAALGLPDLAGAHDFRFIDLSQGDFVDETGTLLSTILYDNDVIITTTLPKTHHQTGVSLLLKSLALGLIDGRQELHDNGIVDVTIAQANLLIRRQRQIIGILDARRGQEGLGPHFGEPIEPSFMLFGTDLVSLDATAARLMGFEPAHIEHIAQSAREGLGTMNPERITGDIQLIKPQRFSASPDWSFAMIENNTASIVFWLDESGIGHLRRYRLDSKTQQFIFERSWDIRFNDNSINLKAAEKWVFDQGGYQRVIASRSGRFNANPPVTFSPKTDPHSGQISPWRRHFDFEGIGSVAQSISDLARHGSLTIRISPKGRGHVLTYDKKFMNPASYSPAEIREIHMSERLAGHLARLGVETIMVHAGTLSYEFTAEIEHILYRG